MKSFLMFVTTLAVGAVFSGCDPFVDAQYEAIQSSQRAAREESAELKARVGAESAEVSALLDRAAQCCDDDADGDSLAIALISVGKTEQESAVLNQTDVQYAFVNLGYRIKHLVCLNNAGSEDDLLACDLKLGLAGLFEGYPFLERGTLNMAGSTDQVDFDLATYLDAAYALYVAAYDTYGLKTPQVYFDLKTTADAVAKASTARLTQSKNLVSMMLALTAAGTETASKTEVSMNDVDALAQIDTSLGLTMLAFQANASSSAESKERLDAAVNAALAGSQFQEAQTLANAQATFNLQFLNLRTQMDRESASYDAVSKTMKTKHDTVKNSINNVR